MEKIDIVDTSVASVIRGGGMEEDVSVAGVYTIVCIGPDGVEKWRDEYKNLVTNVGKANLLDVYLGGSGTTTQITTWYLGLVNATPTFNSGDTAASHAGWTENVDYSNANRPTATFAAATGTGGGAGSAGAGSKATSATAFNINNTATIAGTFLISNNTKSGTTGILYSAGPFTGGNRSVANGDTLNVTYTATC